MGTITKRGNRFRAQVRVGGASLSKSFANRADAAKWVKATEVAVERGEGHDPGRVRFSELVAEYRRVATSKRAFGRSKDAALLAIEKALGKYRLSELRTNVFISFAERREAEGAGPATIGQDFSFIGTTIRHAAPLMGLEHGAAAALAGLGAAKATLRHAGRVGRGTERRRRPTDAELQALLEHWAGKPRMSTPLWDIVLFAVATAMRLGEITRLDWADFDEAGRTIVIRERKHPTAKATNDQRVPLLRGPCRVADDVIDPVEVMLRQRTAWGRQGRVFPYDERTVSRLFARAVEDTGIEDLHFHDLRHDGASRFFEAGYAIEQVALLTGHRDWNQLRRYTQLRAESLHRDPASDAAPTGPDVPPPPPSNVVSLGEVRRRER